MKHSSLPVIRHLLIIFCFLTCSISVQAQKHADMHTKSKGALKAFDEGASYYDNRQFDEAIRCFEQAIKRDTNFIEAYIVLAEVQAMKGDVESAIEAYQRAIGVAPGYFPNNYYQLGRLQFRAAKYAEAKASIEEFRNRVKSPLPDQDATASLISRSCDFAIDALAHPVAFKPFNLGPAINSENSDYYPTFTVDQKEVIFTRDIPDRNAMEGHQEDFYISQKKDSAWQPARNAGGPLNSELNEGAPSVSADGRVLFFTACDRPDGQGSCDIYLSTRMNDGTWSRPVDLGQPVNSAAWESQPSFSSDGKTLYFLRGTYGRDRKMQQDIYVSEFQQDRTWSQPKRLPDYINSDGREESVFIHPDNQTLYFSSNGLPGMGGLDIYMSRKEADGSWGKPVNLGYPVNTEKDENSLVVSADGKTAYFASDRVGGYGKLDLYGFALSESLRPKLVSYVRARVIDADTKAALAAKFEIVDLESGKVMVSNATDSKRGEFMASLPAGKNYLLNVNKETYLFYSDHFECKEANDQQHAYELTIALHKPKAGEKVVLKNIFFETAKFNLKEESTPELMRLVDYLKSNATVRIEVAGHTDNVGDAKLNQDLSNNRAKAVYDFLVKNGIDATRLVYKGYGATKPVADNATEEGRAANRRTEFTIL